MARRDDGTATPEQPTTGQPQMRRRGMIAAAAAIAVGLSVRNAEKVAAADLVVEANNPSTRTTALRATNTFSQVGGAGVFIGDGSLAPNTGGQDIVGLWGIAGGENGTGVIGNGKGASSQANSTDFSRGAGVLGRADGVASGVVGLVNGSNIVTPADNIDPNLTNSAGVLGTGDGASRSGVVGLANSRPAIIGRASGGGTGVIGISAGGYGVLGITTGGTASLAGISTNVNTPAFAGGNAVAGGLAARFNGGVYVDGSFVVANPSLKSGLIAHPDGSHRLVYCVEAPESWIEDFGTGTVANGRASVAIDADFAAMMDTDREYHVFLSDYGKNALSVAGRTPRGFTVEADAEVLKLRGKNAAEATGTFSYRIVAKPRDNKSSRFARYTPPKPWKVEVPRGGTDTPGADTPAPPAGGNPAPAPPRR